MHGLLSQSGPDSAAAQWFWLVSWIMIIGALSVLVIVVMGVGRRWKRRQLRAIEADRQARRAGQAAERVDAWAAGSDRYVDHDKLSDAEAYRHENEPPHGDHDRDDEEDPPIPGSTAGEPGEMPEPDEEDNDPYDLFSDKPYRDSDDIDELDDEEDEDDGDWGGEDERR